MSGVAGLPMYDLPELRPATDALWSAIATALAARGVAGVPAALDRVRPLEALWTDPRLLLAQTCGYPLTHALAGRVRLVATPRYAAPGCDGPRYTSVVVVPRGASARALPELRGAVAAINVDASHSGMNALRRAVAPLAVGGRFFGDVVRTGGHRASLERVAAGAADVAAIDCVTFALLGRVAPELAARVRVVAETAPAPALPYVTRADAGDDEVAALRAALADAAVALAPAHRAALLLDGFEVLPRAAYDAIDAAEAEARALGYPEVA